MKVKCINNGIMEESLTIGKIYNVIDTSRNSYRLIDDFGDTHYFLKSRFEVVEKPTRIVYPW